MRIKLNYIFIIEFNIIFFFVYDNSGSSSFITTPAPVQDFFETVATEVPDQDKYHLENYMWALALVNNTADALVFMDNGTEIVLQLSKDSNV